MEFTKKRGVIKLVTSLLFMVPVLAPASNSLSGQDKAMILMGKEIQSNAKLEDLIGEIPNLQQGKLEAEDVLKAVKNNSPEMFESAGNESGHDETTFMFLSHSLGQIGVRDAIEFAANLENVAIIFRGIPDGMNITESAAMLHALVKGIENPPAIYINPTLFEKFSIDKVPSIVVQGKDNKGSNSDYDLMVAGISDPNWLIARHKDGEKGDLGLQGPVEDISEKDIVEAIKEKVMAIDWEKKKDDAMANFWTNQKFIPVVTALEDRVKYIDPSIVVSRDIPLPDGGFLAREGDIINPLKIRDFTQLLIVFDGTNPKEVEAVQRIVKEKQERGDKRAIRFITTQIDKEAGWDSYETMSDEFDEPIYVLTEDVRTRFEIEFTPSLVESEGYKFKITEVKP